MASGSVQIPAHSGVTGVLRVIEQVLRLRGVRAVQISADGKVTYDYEEGDTDVLDAIRDAPGVTDLFRDIGLTEVAESATKNPVIHLLAEVEFQGLFPLLFVVQDPARVGTWLESVFYCRFGRTLLGVPVVQSDLPESAIVLFAGPTPRGDTYSTTHGFKTNLPSEDA